MSSPVLVSNVRLDTSPKRFPDFVTTTFPNTCLEYHFSSSGIFILSSSIFIKLLLSFCFFLYLRLVPLPHLDFLWKLLLLRKRLYLSFIFYYKFFYYLLYIFLFFRLRSLFFSLIPFHRKQRGGCVFSTTYIFK